MRKKIKKVKKKKKRRTMLGSGKSSRPPPSLSLENIPPAPFRLPYVPTGPFTRGTSASPPAENPRASSAPGNPPPPLIPPPPPQPLVPAKISVHDFTAAVLNHQVVAGGGKAGKLKSTENYDQVFEVSVGKGKEVKSRSKVDTITSKGKSAWISKIFEEGGNDGAFNGIY